MAAMGRRRKDNPLGLPNRVYAKNGAFYYVTRQNRWEHIGTDVKAAIAEGNRRNADTDIGLVNWWWHRWLRVMKDRIGKPKSAHGIRQRTFDDYEGAGDYLLPAFGTLTPSEVSPVGVGAYLDAHAAAGRPIQANRDKAALSSFMSWLVRQEDSGVSVNPCLGVRRNPETKRARYVEDAEFSAVLAHAVPQVRGLLELIYRTLQRPEDVLGWNIRNFRSRDGKDCIWSRQGKTGAEVWIEISPEIRQVVDELWGARGMVVGVPLIRAIRGKHNDRAYTYDGLCSMLRRYQAKVREAGGHCDPFGPYDLKAKGATDMYLAGVPLERIQALCGHDSVKTTEIYVKCRIREVVQPNRVPRRA